MTLSEIYPTLSEKAQVIRMVSWAFIDSRAASSDGGYQCIATKVDGETHSQFKDAYGPPEHFV